MHLNELQFACFLCNVQDCGSELSDFKTDHSPYLAKYPLDFLLKKTKVLENLMYNEASWHIYKDPYQTSININRKGHLLFCIKCGIS